MEPPCGRPMEPIRGRPNGATLVSREEALGHVHSLRLNFQNDYLSLSTKPGEEDVKQEVRSVRDSQYH